MKEYRIKKAMELLRTTNDSIAFSSPMKCHKTMMGRKLSG